MMKQRRFWLLLHRWTGLAIAVFVAIAGLTGAAISFSRELDGWLNPTWHRVASGEEPLALSELVTRVEARHPDRMVTGITLAHHPDQSIQLSLDARPNVRRPGDHDGGLPVDDVFVDPYRGTILGERAIGTVSLAREHLIPFLYLLHYSLHLGGVGEWMLGVVCLLWLIAMLMGIYLAWPKRGKWKQVFSIKRSASTYRTLHDLHRAGGMLGAAVLLTVAWTGLWWNMSYVMRPAVAALLPTSPWYPGALPAMPAAQYFVTPERAVAAAQAARPDGTPLRIRANHEKGVYWVYLKQSDDAGIYPSTAVFVSMTSGEVMHITGPANSRAGDLYELWQLPLHTGQFLGLPGRILWCVAGLLPLLLTVTGIMVWLKKRRAEAIAEARRAMQSLSERGTSVVTMP